MWSLAVYAIVDILRVAINLSAIGEDRGDNVANTNTILCVLCIETLVHPNYNASSSSELILKSSNISIGTL